MWQGRTLDELRDAKPGYSHDTTDLVVHVNREEAVLLCLMGATVVSSGSRNLERGTQKYNFEA